MHYSKDILLSFSNRKNRLPLQTYTCIKQLGISTTKPTLRGPSLRHTLSSLFSTQQDHTPNSFNLTAALLNVHSLHNKSSFVHDFITGHKLDFLALTETWLHADGSDSSTSSPATPSNYQFLNYLRKNRRGSGVALICKSSLKPSVLKSSIYSTFEAQLVRLFYPFQHCYYLPAER